MSTGETPRPSPANVAMTLLLWAALTAVGLAVVVFGYGAICATAVYNSREQRHRSNESAAPGRNDDAPPAAHSRTE
ncbi:hypothetical protein GobsT_23970 [Gemmata obscuriglobus]|uniref:Uncharacterized protein n=1 Tax=Gemmata obscuriglobus TaxID=114 RepID=A0A2Z3HDE7_9BACT|nr:hypothetical protein [Gemmata obscuriglobus]AWM39300.1 hypothetical protein C1280_21455 [Gemmata obscuriglobus]QEG27638.1 hypothetical protein GobsT_23970 [Gemmata obscuriglobus]VTS04799.1 unnamed protein product [Gemmata obscuriglobus UQM 2246]